MPTPKQRHHAAEVTRNHDDDDNADDDEHNHDCNSQQQRNEKTHGFLLPHTRRDVTCCGVPVVCDDNQLATATSNSQLHHYPTRPPPSTIASSPAQRYRYAMQHALSLSCKHLPSPISHRPRRTRIPCPNPSHPIASSFVLRNIHTPYYSTTLRSVT
jgi:hypothetical protein